MTKISSRYQCLILTGAGVVPTVPSTPTFTADDVGWNNATDIHIGEWAFNKTDNKWFYRNSSGIVEFTQGSAPDWGDIGGTLADQVDLQAALDAKADSSSVTTLDGQVVKKTGAQTVAGDKDFTGATKASKKSISEKTADYTLVLGDAGGRIVVNDASDIEITIPPQADVTWTDDTEIEIFRRGAGAVTIVAGSGVTLESKDSLVDIADRYTSVLLKREASDVWSIQGNLG